MTKYGFRDNKVTAKKVIVKGKIPIQYIIPKTVAEGTSSIMTGVDLHANGTTALTNTGLTAQPTYPAVLKLNWNAAGTAGNTDGLIIVGKDAKGVTRTETLTMSSAAAGNDSTNYAYAQITSITPNAVCKSTDVGLGMTKTIGLPYPIATSGDIISYTYDGAFATSDFPFTIDTTYETFTMGTMGAGVTAQIIYLTYLQE